MIILTNREYPLIHNKTQSRCPVSGKCGGCRYIDVEYKKQLSLKQKKMEELLGRFGTVKPIVGMENPEHYRNKVHAVFHFDRKKGITSGIYEDKALSAPLRLRIYSVSGNARGILYYGAALSDYFIEQRALPDVRAPDYRYYRL